jgi:hypothetical protein
MERLDLVKAQANPWKSEAGAMYEIALQIHDLMLEIRELRKDLVINYGRFTSGFERDPR